jgi:hypothetical protein
VNFPNVPSVPDPEKAGSNAVDSAERKALIELRKAHGNLRVMFHLLALSCLMLTGIIFVIIYKQLSLLRRDFDEMTASVNDYQKTFVPQVEALRVNLEAFAKTNESFRPILQRFFPTNAPKGSSVEPRAADTGAGVRKRQ